MSKTSIKKKEEFVYEFYQQVEIPIEGSDKIKIEEDLIATIDKRELGNRMLILTNELKEMININNAIISFELNEHIKKTKDLQTKIEFPEK
ncbi:MAG: hypothetical protein PHC93_05925 [Candidatus Omnitrophica bacterium]|nr:hypothetical protein [Candidatus Omnitrophota bacterium]